MKKAFDGVSAYAGRDSKYTPDAASIPADGIPRAAFDRVLAALPAVATSSSPPRPRVDHVSRNIDIHTYNVLMETS